MALDEMDQDRMMKAKRFLFKARIWAASPVEGDPDSLRVSMGVGRHGTKQYRSRTAIIRFVHNPRDKSEERD